MLLHAVPFAAGGPGLHSPVHESHTPGSASHSCCPHVTPKHGSVAAGLGGFNCVACAHGCWQARARRSHQPLPVHTPPWQVPPGMLVHGVPLSAVGPAPHSPMLGSHVPGAVVHSACPHMTPAQRSAVAVLEGAAFNY